MVTAIKDSHTYPTGIKVSDEELNVLHLVRNDFHGEWNDAWYRENHPEQPAEQNDGFFLPEYE